MKRHSRRSGHAVQDGSFVETTMVSLDQRGVLIHELVTGFADLWKEETFCDVTIVCPEGKLRCHAAMLAALSPLLKDLLQDQEGSEEIYISMPDADIDNMRMLFNLIYCGELVLNSDEVVALSDLALQMGFIRLTHVFERTLLALKRTPGDAAVASRSSTLMKWRMKQQFEQRRRKLLAKRKKLAKARQKKPLARRKKLRQALARKVKEESLNLGDASEDPIGPVDPFMSDDSGNEERNIFDTEGTQESSFEYTVEYTEDAAVRQHCSCDICGNQFIDQVRLLNHKKRFHNEQISCPICNAMDFESLSHHIRNKHPERKFICQECGKSFTRMEHMKDHREAIHASMRQKQYDCNECGKCFYRKSSLRMHKRVHTDKAYYICPMCGKGFRHTSTYGCHLKTHSNERAYVCDICGKSFKTKNNLRQHRKLHLGKQLICSVCGKAFGRLDYLRKHMQSVHKEPIQPVSSGGVLQRIQLQTMDSGEHISVVAVSEPQQGTAETIHHQIIPLFRVEEMAGEAAITASFKSDGTAEFNGVNFGVWDLSQGKINPASF